MTNPEPPPGVIHVPCTKCGGERRHLGIGQCWDCMTPAAQEKFAHGHTGLEGPGPTSADYYLETIKRADDALAIGIPSVARRLLRGALPREWPQDNPPPYPADDEGQEAPA